MRAGTAWDASKKNSCARIPASINGPWAKKLRARDFREFGKDRCGPPPGHRMETLAIVRSFYKHLLCFLPSPGTSFGNHRVAVSIDKSSKNGVGNHAAEGNRKITCRTPTPGKQPTNIDRWKFDLVRSAILRVVFGEFEAAAARGTGIAFLVCDGGQAGTGSPRRTGPHRRRDAPATSKVLTRERPELPVLVIPVTASTRDRQARGGTERIRTGHKRGNRGPFVESCRRNR
jgi:hypothetical protein